jgi:hypothetical protein
MSYSGESDTESVSETNIQSYKCHVCQYKPDFNSLIFLLQQIVNVGPFLLTLPDGTFYVRCLFEECSRYYHIHCIHPTFPDEHLNQCHFEDLRENGIHCPKCEPGRSATNF